MYHLIREFRRVQMQKKVLALSIILLLTTISLTSISFVQAASDNQWITDYTINDASTNELLVEHIASTNTTTIFSPVLPGADIKVTFTVEVVAGEGELTLTSGLSKSSSQSQYWSLVTDDYPMGPNYNPAQASTKFNWNEGTFEMILYGKVPTSASTTKSINIVSLYGPSGTVLDRITITSTSAKMNTYLTLFSDKNAQLNGLISSGVDQGYINVYTNVLNVSKAVAEGGDVDSAIALLNGLDASNAPGSTLPIIFYPIIGVTAAIAVLFVVLFLRSRSKVSYFTLVVEDQIKDLEGLTMRAAKIDRAMSANLDSIKDRLKHLVGM
jgi:hypothetical protein